MFLYIYVYIYLYVSIYVYTHTKYAFINIQIMLQNTENIATTELSSSLRQIYRCFLTSSGTCNILSPAHQTPGHPQIMVVVQNASRGRY